MEAAMDLKTFAARLKELREAAGLSQKELAERAGVSQKAVSHWEQGQREPGLFVAPTLAGALGVTVEKLMEEPSRVPEPKRGRPRKAEAEEPKKPRKGKGAK
jgi:transcriptional regulator with XRE-family HTH domain